MVVGTEKTRQIDELPLLAWYAGIFKRVLMAGDMRLMIVGYGFGDEHINAVVADAIANHGLQVFIWGGSSIKERVLAGAHGGMIWSGVMSTASQTMREVFPPSQAETGEFKRIWLSFFGERRPSDRGTAGAL